MTQSVLGINISYCEMNKFANLPILRNELVSQNGQVLIWKVGVRGCDEQRDNRP